MDSDSSIENKLNQAIVSLDKRAWADSLVEGREIIALIAAARAQAPNVFGDELRLATIIVGISEASGGSFSAAADAFLSSNITTDAIGKISGTQVAVMAALSVIANPVVSRKEIICTLTDCSKSCIRDHLDYDLFADFRELGWKTQSCDFFTALNILSRIVESDLLETLNKKRIADVVSNFKDFCISQVVSCHECLEISECAGLLGIPEDELMHRLESLISGGAFALGNHRVDLQHNCIIRSAFGANHRTLASNLHQAMQNIELLKFRRILADGNLRVEN